MRDLSPDVHRVRARRLSTHVSISIRACIIVRRVYALPPRNFMEILEYILRVRPHLARMPRVIIYRVITASKKYS